MTGRRGPAAGDGAARELLLVAAMSIAGNIVHAWLNAPTGKEWVAAFVASFPPIALLAATHGVGLLVRAQNKARLAYWAVVALTAAIAVIAFRLSFDALRELSIQVGMSERLAFLFPLIIDGAIGQARTGTGPHPRTGTHRLGPRGPHRNPLHHQPTHRRTRPDRDRRRRADRDRTGRAPAATAAREFTEEGPH
ncbi:DUF2637 domain-containing protein [Nocardia takedensis]|uniref:DUF2637 domain-containing protein n=1 Tax=Nocardia takedensis TaxID=259390 RepID=UPI003F773121